MKGRKGESFSFFVFRPVDDGKYHPEYDNIFDPNEDRGYDFTYRTSNHIKEEHANRVGDVQGRLVFSILNLLLTFSKERKCRSIYCLHRVN